MFLLYDPDFYPTTYFKVILKGPMQGIFLIITIYYQPGLFRGSYVYPGMIQTLVVTIK